MDLFALKEINRLDTVTFIQTTISSKLIDLTPISKKRLSQKWETPREAN